MGLFLLITNSISYKEKALDASGRNVAEAKDSANIIPPPENRSIIVAKFIKLDKIEPLRVVAKVTVLQSEDVEDYPNFTRAGQEINVLFVLYPKAGEEELDPDNPVNKERLAILEAKKGDDLWMEVSFDGPSMWFGHRAWKEAVDSTRQ